MLLILPRYHTLLLLAACAYLPRVIAQPAVYAEIESFSYSEPVPVRANFNDWRTPSFQSGKVVLTHNRVETGVAIGPWQFGLVARYDYYLDFTEDAAELYYRIQNDQSLEVGRTYTVDINVEQYSATGIRLAYRLFSKSNMSLSLGITYLEGRRLTDGFLRGQATSVGAKDYDFDFDVDYRYSKDTLFDRSVVSPDGRGYSIDLHMDWRPLERVGVNLKIIDLLGRIYWENAPFTLGLATSDIKTFDEQGFVQFKPALSGFEGNRDFTQRLLPRTTVAVAYEIDETFDALAEIHNTRLKTFPSIGMAYRRGEGEQQWQGLYTIGTGAVTIRYLAKRWQIALITDDIKPSLARTLGINAQIHWDM